MKLSQGNSTGWYHANVRKDGSIKLRPIRTASFEPGRNFSNEEFGTTFTVQEQLSFKEISKMTGLPVHTFSTEEPSAWAFVVEQIERRQNEPPKTLVPVTKLRFLYDWLRTMPKEVHAAIARGFAACPETMVELCLLSQKHFTSYRPSHPFEAGKRTEYEGREEEEVKRTRSLVNLFEKVAQSIITVNTRPNDLSLDCWYVERELDPRTTRQGVLETGEPATSTGTGGIDLLMAHANDGLPIVGEVKIFRDTNPFFGLVQALMYAVELCTPQQQQRLRQSFPKRFGTLTGEPRADVYLLLKDCPKDDLHKQIQKDTEALIAGMYQRKSIASVIRRIVCLKVSVDRSKELALNFLFGHGE
jgi:hypothetical protein